MADQITEFLDTQKEFVKDGTQFINRCTKPDRTEYLKICQAVGVGFVVCYATRSQPSPTQPNPT